MPKDPDRLPLVIGVTGHRDPLDPASLERQLEGIFRQFRVRAPHTPIVLLSPLAEGCDQIFAEVGLRVLEDHAPGVELAVPMPFALDDYRCDFLGSPEAAARFERLLGRARWTIPLPPRSAEDLVAWTGSDGKVLRRVGGLPDPGKSPVRDLHYDRLGRFMATHAHVMVSMWNGWNAPLVAGKRTLVGGTWAITRYCREGDATCDSEPVPLRPSLSPVLRTGSVPVLLVHTARRGDAAASPPRPDLAAELRCAVGLTPDATLDRRAEAGAAWGGKDSPAPESGGVGEGNRSWNELTSALRQVDAINELPPRCVGEGGAGGGSPRHRAAARWATPLRTVWKCVAWMLPNPARGGESGRGAGPSAMLREFRRDLEETFRERIPGAYLDARLEGAVEAGGDAESRSILAMYRRADAVANFDKWAYEVFGSVAAAVLFCCLLMAQHFSAWQSVWSVSAYLGGLFVYVGCRRQLKDWERDRATSRCVAEFLRVQLAWTATGVGRQPADALLARRTVELREFRYVLRCTEFISAVILARAEAVRETASDLGRMEGVRTGWVEAQAGYLEGPSVRRKKARSDRRERRKGLLRGCVVVTAAIALLIAVLAVMGGDGGGGESALPWANFLIGLSLVTMLITDLRSSISLDREDAQAAAGMRPIFGNAAERMRAELAADGVGAVPSAREVLERLGENVLDDQIEWYLRHRDGAQVDVVG